MKKLLLLALLLCGCSTSEHSENFSFKSNNFGSGEITIEDIFIQKYDKYLVYFYSNSCLHCINLKKTISDFINNEYFPIFKVEIKEGYVSKIDEVEDSVGSTNYDYVFAGATPQLSIIENHQVQCSVVGEEDIRIMLSTFIK